jgi:hypothetical protein
MVAPILDWPVGVETRGKSDEGGVVAGVFTALIYGAALWYLILPAAGHLLRWLVGAACGL